MRGRLSLAAAVALLSAGCIDKPLRPSDRPQPDGGPGDHDAGADAGACDDPDDMRTAWDADDVVRFDQTVAQLNGDCFDDIVVPGATDADTFGVFVILGRQTPDFFTGGYDQFVETTDSEPLRVAATDLVGDEALDLVVFARSTMAPDVDEAEVRVFQGVGDGSFLPDDISRRIDGSVIPRPLPDDPSHYVVDTMSVEAGGVAELLIGDLESTFVVAPASWTQAGLNDAQIVTPFDAANSQGVVVAPSGRSGANDLVQVDNQNWNWFFNQGDLDYGAGAVAAMIDSGPRVLRAPSFEREDTDIASVSVQAERLSFLFVIAPGGEDASGQIVVKPFRDASIGAADGLVDAVELIPLGGGTAPELLILDDGEGTDDARLWLYHDVADAGARVDPVGDPGEVTAAPFDADHPYNRMAVGAFRDPSLVKVYLFSSAPGVTAPICWLPDPDSGELSRCN